MRAKYHSIKISAARLGVLAMLLCARASAARAAPEAKVGPQSYGLPERLTSLTDTQLVLGRHLKDGERAGVLLYWLARERNTPSPTTPGVGGPIDSVYLQTQLLQMLGHFPAALEKALDLQGVDPGMRDAVAIALGLSGDRRRTNDLIRILKTSAEGHFRELAAEALGFNLQAREAIPALRGVLNDPYSVTMPPPDVRGPGDPDDDYTAYPVRATARAALRLLERLAPDERNEVVEAYEKTVARAKSDPDFKPVPEWALLAITARGTPSAPPPAGDGPPAGPVAYGLPDRITSLVETQRLAPDSPLSRVQKTEVLLYWIAQERQNPEAKSPVSDFPNYTDYIQSQLTGALMERGDAAMLDAITHDERVAPWAREAAQLGLGLKGDKAQVPVLIRALKTDPRGEFRVLAAHALGTCGAKEAIPALEAAMTSDPYKRLYYGHLSSGYEIGPDGMYYPVREEAKEAHRNLHDEEAIAEEERFNRPFLRGLEEYRASTAVGRQATLAPWLLAKIGVGASEPPTSPSSQEGTGEQK